LAFTEEGAGLTSRGGLRRRPAVSDDVFGIAQAGEGLDHEDE
jgi:hypothetical protein